MGSTARDRWRAAALFIAPLVLLASFLAHPHIGNSPTDPGIAEAIAAEVSAHSGTWILAHALTALGSAVLALAFIGLRGLLREAGEERWSPVGLVFAVLGCVAFALLPAMEMAPVAAHEAGVDVAAVQHALDETVFAPTLLAGSALFAVGAIAMAVGTYKSGILGRGTGAIVAGALAAVAITRFVPLFAVLFYVQSAALIVALWPVAYLLWRRENPPASSQAHGPQEDPG